jgi:hypothetical protein
MSMDERFAALRDAGIDVEVMREDARDAVEAATPPGWVAVMIRSPWHEEDCPSPGCGTHIHTGNLGIAVLTKKLHRVRTLLFTLTVVCEDCASDRDRLSLLSVLTFQ